MQPPHTKNKYYKFLNYSNRHGTNKRPYLVNLLWEDGLIKSVFTRTRGVGRSKSRVFHCVKSVCIRRFSGPYFPAFELNMERYSLSLRIQSECGKIRARKIPNMDIFYAVFECTFFFNGFLINCYNSEHGLLNPDSLRCCRQYVKTNGPVQTDYLSTQ